MARKDAEEKAILARREQSEDLLFVSTYDHVGSADNCHKCGSGNLVARPPRIPNGPEVHYSVIGSGNQVMKDGRKRDQLARPLGILCFEMEAAGLADQFKYRVITTTLIPLRVISGNNMKGRSSGVCKILLSETPVARKHNGKRCIRLPYPTED
ncbi:uncharacterized protein ATNIH1004_008663 [Aspergillus tanneri]|uniref:Uncharacterized protein n=1 Tax=Aspergillus tanneri TaxID=1220188 RepID=A0A5M9MJ57_9EURO|nr:uncharacterized protein ATNIH1004_008663 [Aspergillus tanneri]KAA8644459.1 hypothetical protein ATNIH1004_008663 [Aspergillus tanneri]